MYSLLYDPKLMKPSRLGIDYLLPIFTDAVGNDDMEHIRLTLFAPGNLAQPYHSINTDINAAGNQYRQARCLSAGHRRAQS
jgi:hypothetical protein